MLQIQVSHYSEINPYKQQNYYYYYYFLSYCKVMSQKVLKETVS